MIRIIRDFRGREPLLAVDLNVEQLFDAYLGHVGAVCCFNRLARVGGCPSEERQVELRVIVDHEIGLW